MRPYGCRRSELLERLVRQRMGHGHDPRQEFLRGMQLIFGANPTNNERMGMRVASQMLQELDQLEAQGIKIDRTVVFNAYKKAFLNDSVNPMQIGKVQETFRSVMQKAQEEAEAAKMAEQEKAPDAQANVTAGEEYVAKLKAENPNAQTLPSGLVYVIEEPCVGPNAAPPHSTFRALSKASAKVSSSSARAARLLSTSPATSVTVYRAPVRPVSDPTKCSFSKLSLST